MSGNLRATGLEITGSADISSDLRVTGSAEISTNLSVTGNTTVSGDLVLTEFIKHDGDADTSIRFLNNSIDLYAGNGSTSLRVLNGNVIVNNGGEATIDFRTVTDNLPGAILVDAGADTITLGTTATTFAGMPAEAKGSDVTIVLSGTAGSKDGNSGGSVLVSGDMLVSGSLHIGGKGNNNEASIKSGRHPSQTSFTIWESETAAFNQIRLKNGNHQTQLTNGGFTINSDAQDVNFQYFFPDYDYAISGDAGNKTLSFGRANPPGNDQFFFVSGAIGLKDTAVKGLAVFGGDVLISGSILNSNGVTTAGQKSEIRKNNVFNLASSTSELFFPGSDGEASSGTLNPQRAFLAPYSGSIKKIVIRIQVTNTDPVYRFYKNLNDGEANIIGHFTGSHGNNEVVEYNIDQQTKVIKGGGGSSAITVNGNFNFDPGDLLSISYQGQGGSTPGYANTCIFIEYDTTSIIE